MSDAAAILALVTAVGCGCTGGALYAFSAFVMPALARLPAAGGVAALQAMNVTAVRAPFMLAFMGTAALSVAVAVAGVASLGEAHGPWLLAGALLYLVGVIAVTMGYNVPRNDTLATLAADAPGTPAAWATYVSQWTAANHVRSAAGLLAAAALINAVRVA
jgi:uncharacterized membrane protein